MSGNEVTNYEHGATPPAVTAMFGSRIASTSGDNSGAIQIEQGRAFAEAQGQSALAKRFPRDENAAYAELMEACSSNAPLHQNMTRVNRLSSEPTNTAGGQSPRGLLTPKDVESRYGGGVTVRRLRGWRYNATSNGPHFVTLAARIFYPIADLEAWERSRGITQAPGVHTP